MTDFRVVFDQPADQHAAIPGGPTFIATSYTPNELIRSVEEYVRRPQQAWADDLFVVVEPSEYGRKIRGEIYIGQDIANSFTATPVDSSVDDIGGHPQSLDALQMASALCDRFTPHDLIGLSKLDRKARVAQSEARQTLFDYVNALWSKAEDNGAIPPTTRSSLSSQPFVP